MTTRRLAALVVVIVLGLVAIVFVRTVTFTPGAVQVAPGPAVPLRSGAAERLAGAIRIPTLAAEDPAEQDEGAFLAMREYIRAQYPRIHASFTPEVIGGASLLYTWSGSAPDAPALLLMGHMDVVPVEAGTESRWAHPPFSGAIADGFVWGRGALDDKSSMLAALESVENLLEQQFRPRRTVYLAFGHDEETGGRRGARAIAAVLQERGVRLEMVLDEGGIIADGMFPGVTVPVAVVGVAEKGVVNIELIAHAPGGHASMPSRRTAIGALAAAITKIERTPMPARLDEPTAALFATVGPLLPLAPRAAFANLWITRPLVVRQLASIPSMNAAVRTTMAVTIAAAGVKENVLPSQARAVINARILPGDTAVGVVDHVRRVVDDPGIAVAAIGEPWNPSPVSSRDSDGFHALERAIRQTVPEAVVAPYLVPGATDSRHYQALTASVYRLLPLRLTPSDVERLHGTDERVAVADYERAIGVVQRLIADIAGGATTSRP